MKSFSPLRYKEKYFPNGKNFATANFKDLFPFELNRHDITSKQGFAEILKTLLKSVKESQDYLFVKCDIAVVIFFIKVFYMNSCKGFLKW